MGDKSLMKYYEDVQADQDSHPVGPQPELERCLCCDRQTRNRRSVHGLEVPACGDVCASAAERSIADALGAVLNSLFSCH